MKIGVIGLGYWGPNIVRNLIQLGMDVVIYDRIHSKTDKMFEQFPQTRPVYSEDFVFNDSEINAIVLAVPLHEHYKLIRRSIRSKKHVFVEKPLCSTLDEVNKLNDIIGNTILMVGHITHFSPGIQRLREVLNTGAIGDIKCHSLTRTHLGPIYMGTDVLTEVAAHDMAIISLLKEEMPEYLCAWGFRRLGLDNPDSAFMIINWADGLTAKIDVQWTSIHRRRTIISEGTKGTLEFHSNKKSEHLTLFHQENAFKSLQRGESPGNASDNITITPIALNHCEPLREELIHFINCVEANVTPITDLSFSKKVVSMLQSARNSMRNNGEREKVS